MDMILNHFEQIAFSATAIAELPFPESRIFTNALLQSHDITALIRDTEVHETALFTAATSEPANNRKSIAPTASTGEHALSGLKPGTAVGRILGSDLQRRIRRSERLKGTVDVDLLLEGAEKLCAAYPMPGVLERIQSMRTRHEKLASSISFYEEKLAEQAAEFEQLSLQPRKIWGTEGVSRQTDENLPPEAAEIETHSLDDEEAEVHQLEEKKRGLEEQVMGLEKDLGGLRG